MTSKELVENISFNQLLLYTRDGEWGVEKEAPGTTLCYVIRGADFADISLLKLDKVPKRYIENKKLATKRLEPNDLIIETAGGTKDRPTGRTIFLPVSLFEKSDLPIVCASFSRFLRTKKEKCNARFLFYNLTNMYNQGQLEKYNVQHTGVSRFQFTDFSLRTEIPLPSLKHQQEFADFIGLFDDKIQINSLINRNLYEIIKLVFNRWFIEYNFPTVEGKPYKLNGGKMKPSEIGDVPEDWIICPLREAIAHYIGGGWGEESNYEGAKDSYVIRGRDLPQLKLSDVSKLPLRFHKAKNYAVRKLLAQDIIIEISGGSKDQPVGRTAMIDQAMLDLLGNKVICASFCKQIRIKETFSPYYIYLLIDWLYDNRQIMKYQVQSTGITNFNFEFFIDDIRIPVLPPDLRRNFDSLMTTLFSNLTANALENRLLSSLRDTLLPMIFSQKYQTVERLEVT